MLFLLTQVWPGLLVSFALGAAMGLLVRRSLSGVALRTDLPDMSYYMLRAETVVPPELSAYARWTDLPDVSQFVTTQTLARYVRKEELDAQPFPDLSDFVTKADLVGLVDGGESGTRQAPDVPDLSAYVRKSELPDLSGLASTKELRAQLQERDREIAELRASLVAERAARTGDVARLETRVGLQVPLVSPPTRTKMRRSEAVKSTPA